MTETQSTISEWAEATFGPAGSNLRCATRANEEMAELLRELALDDRSPKAPDEAADIAIVLCRLAQRMKFSLTDETAKRSYEFFPRRTSGVSAAISANREMGRLLSRLEIEDDHPQAAQQAAHAAGGVILWLVRLLQISGSDLWQEVDRKMAINRARTWHLDGSGHGYHIDSTQP